MRPPSVGWTVLSQPREDLIMPVTTVGWFCDPVAFIRKVDELAGNSQSLQCRKQLMTFADRDSEVEIIMNDEHRGLEVGRESMR